MPSGRQPPQLLAATVLWLPLLLLLPHLPLWLLLLRPLALLQLLPLPLSPHLPPQAR